MNILIVGGGAREHAIAWYEFSMTPLQNSTRKIVLKSFKEIKYLKKMKVEMYIR